LEKLNPPGVTAKGSWKSEGFFLQIIFHFFLKRIFYFLPW
jgi:hypothetical protein